MYFQNYNTEYFTQEEFEKAYELIKTGLVAGITPDAGKCTIILGGQPGAGKSTFYQMRDDLENYVAINGDDFRRFHPHHKEYVCVYSFKNTPDSSMKMLSSFNILHLGIALKKNGGELPRH